MVPLGLLGFNRFLLSSRRSLFLSYLSDDVAKGSGASLGLATPICFGIPSSGAMGAPPADLRICVLRVFTLLLGKISERAKVEISLLGRRNNLVLGQCQRQLYFGHSGFGLVLYFLFRRATLYPGGQL